MSGEDGNDNERTGRRRLVMGSDTRDLAGLRRVKQDQKRAATGAGVPAGPFEGDDTGLTERIEADDDLRRLFAKGEKNRQLIAALSREAADRDLEIAGEKPPDERFKGIERNLKFVHLVIVLIAIPVVTSTVLVAKYIYGRGIAEGTTQVEQRHLADDIAEVKRELADNARQLSDLHDGVARLQQHQDDLGRRRPAAQDSPHTPKDPTTP